MYHYRNRYYHAQLGRFVSRDPIGYAGLDSNLYNYVFNHPVALTDPTGEIAPLPYVFALAAAWWAVQADNAHAPQDDAEVSGAEALDTQREADNFNHGIVVITVGGAGAAAAAAGGGTAAATELVDTAVDEGVAAATGGVVPGLPCSITDVATDVGRRVGRQLYGPFHRSDLPLNCFNMKDTGELIGFPPRQTGGGRSPFPAAQAYDGALPPNRNGIEFYTPVEPDLWAPNISPRVDWKGRRNDDMHRIPIDVRKIHQDGQTFTYPGNE